MKKIKDFVLDDMWNHNLMSGGEIKGCVLSTVHKTPAEKNAYCQGIFVTFPHMMFSNFSGWMWPEGAPKNYQDFMGGSVKALQEKAFPLLDRYFEAATPDSEKGEIIAKLLTEIIPQHIITGYYQYMFEGQEDYKDISSFWTEVAPLLGMTAELARAAFSGMTLEERAEAFLFFGARYPFLMLKRWYDWQFGPDKLEGGPGGPPPGGPGGPGGPPPGGPGGGPGGPPPM